MTDKEEKARRMALRRGNGTRKLPSPPGESSGRNREYLIAHACFVCRKSWKMKLLEQENVCPECGGDASFMGRSFKAPKTSDTEQWRKVERLWKAGFRFFSYRSYPDAEPLPERLSEVDDFISRNQDHPFRVLAE